MMWQMWTAFGIMLGYIAGVIFRSVLDGDSSICSNDMPEHVLLSVRCVSIHTDRTKRSVYTNVKLVSELAIDAC